MNILLFIPGGVHETDPQETIPAILWLIERMAKDNAVTVIALNQYPEYRQYEMLGAQIINLGYSRRLPLQTLHQKRLHRVLKQCKDLNPDIIHSIWMGECGALAAAVSKAMNVPLASSLGGGEFSWIPEINYGGSGTLRGRRRNRKTVKQSSVVTAGSHHALNQLPCFAHWVPLGVDLDRFKSSVTRPQGPPWRFLHVGDLNPVKNQSLLVDTMRVMRSRGFRFHLDWIGYDTQNNRIERRLAQIGLSEYITLHGMIPNEELPRFYRQSHLFIQTSLHESQGVAQLEASAAGSPTLGTPVGLLNDMAPYSGVAVADDSPEDFADAIEAVLLDAEKRASLARHAQQFAQTFDADWTAQRFLSLYRDTIDKKLKPPQAAYLEHLAATGGDQMHPGKARASLSMLSRADLQPGQAVLEIGCGAGNTLCRLAGIGKMSITGVDINPVMLNIAHQRLQRLHLKRNVKLFKIEPPKLPFANGSFDRVLIESVLAFQEPSVIREMLNEIYRCLKKGGRLLMNEGIWKRETAGATITKVNLQVRDDFDMIYATDEPAHAEGWKELFVATGFRLLSSADISGVILQSPKSSVYIPRLENALESMARSMRMKNKMSPRKGLKNLKYTRAMKKHGRAREHMESRLFILEKPFGG